MDIKDTILVRKSIRDFKSAPVSKDILKEILEFAVQSPSAVNAQPWEFTVVVGEVLENIKKANVDLLTSGAETQPDIPFEALQGIYKQRQVDAAVQLFDLMSITREDKVKRNEWVKKGIRFYDAPAGIIISADRSLNVAQIQFDIGIITQTICLVAVDYGLGTCIQRQNIMYPDVIRKFTGIPDTKQLVIAIAIGYPEWDFQANKREKSRDDVETLTTWCGFN